MARAATSKPKDVVKARPIAQVSTDAAAAAKASPAPTTDVAAPTSIAAVAVSPLALSPAQIAHMVSRFLGWKLPESFKPDGGISFEPGFNNGTAEGGRHEPSGTNLFDATQAEAMVLHMLNGLPGSPVAPTIPSPPLQVALQQGAELAPTLIRVSGPKGGRWRVGQHFTEEPREVAVDAAALAKIEADPALTVERL